MRSLILSLVALVSVMTGVARAQELSGNWQGTLDAGRPLRIVVKIANGDAGALAAVLYSIDQTPQGLAASGVSLQGTTLKFAIPAIGATYEGRLSGDGRAIAGTFTQAGRPIALNLARATADTAWTIPSAPAALAAMPATADPSFEVATVKPSNPGTPGKLFTVRGRQVMTVNTTVDDLVAFAYGVHARQIVKGTGWLETDKFDITGQPDLEGVPNQVQLRRMVQKLLADRFKLTFHREKQELSVYALVVGPKGPMLTKSSMDPNGLPSLLFRGLGSLPAANATMADLASAMQTAVLDRPVVDQTGISGRYDFTLTWTPDETQFASMGVRVPPPPADGSGPPGLFTAFQEQLGLKLESIKAPAEVLVIDRIERPSEN
jgi:bla regulator protein blaR1